MTDETEAPKRIWITPGTILSETKQLDGDVKYYRADRYAALLDAAVSLHHHLFELTDALLNRPDITQSEREMADMVDDAQLAIDKYNRFLDGVDDAQSPQS